ncbi:MAG: sigma factor [Verrucomicrobiota bacterium]
MDADSNNLPNSPGPAFVSEFARCQAKLQSYIRSLLPNRADAVDVFQKTSVTLWRKFDQWESERGVFEALGLWGGVLRSPAIQAHQ